MNVPNYATSAADVNGKTTVDIGTVITLDSAIGHQCNMATANASTAYTLDTPVTGAVTRVFINSATEPSITGATQEGGLVFEASADMYMVVFNKGTDVAPSIVYWFYYKAITSGAIPKEEQVIGTAVENLTMTSTVNLDLDLLSYFKGILTGNTTITVTNPPAINTSFVKNLKISSTTTQTLTLPVTWDIIGEYVADGSDNYFTIIFSNLTTTGENVTCYINQI